MERAERGWTQRELGPGERITLAQPELSLAVDELYAGVTLEPR